MSEPSFLSLSRENRGEVTSDKRQELDPDSLFGTNCINDSLAPQLKSIDLFARPSISTARIKAESELQGGLILQRLATGELEPKSQSIKKLSIRILSVHAVHL